MRRVHKARIVPDHVPDSMTEKVIKVSDVKIPLAAVTGEFHALTNDELLDLIFGLELEGSRRGNAGA